MIVLFVIIFWIFAASSPLEFIVPFLLISIRSCYLTRKIRFSYLHGTFFLVMIFVFATLGESIDYATMMVLRLGLFMLLAGHLLESLKSRMLFVLLSSRPLRGFAGFIYYVDRFLGVMTRRVNDVVYAAGIVYKTKKSLSGKVFVVISSMISIVFEATYSIEQVVLVLTARGDIPSVSEWSSKPQWGWTIPVGDIALTIVTLSALWANKSLFPPTVHHFFDFIRV